MRITSSAPCRLSLFGGGSDVSPYCDLYGGLVISMAIDIRQEFLIDFNESDCLVLPKGGKPDFYRKFFEEFGISEYILSQKFTGEITGGLGSSAAAAVALVGAIAKYKRIPMTKDEIAQKAWEIEVNKCGLFGGKQDQWVAVMGGVNMFEFNKYEVITTHLGLPFIEKVLPSILLFHTGKNREKPNIQENFKHLSPGKIYDLNLIKSLTHEALNVIPRGNIKKFGELVDLSWEVKKSSNKDTTNEEIDLLYEKAKELGAYGGKVCGAGSGGYCFFVVEPKRQERFKKRLGLRWVPFEIDTRGLEVKEIQ